MARLALAAGLMWLLWRHPRALLAMAASSLLGFPQALAIAPGLWTRRADPLRPAADDLPRRRAVWDVLSELYLDTELDAHDHARIADVLRESGYSEAQLEEILYRELHPVLHANLMGLAGEWMGFDLDGIEAEILRRSGRRGPIALIPGKWMVSGGWAAIAARLRRARR